MISIILSGIVRTVEDTQVISSKTNKKLDKQNICVEVQTKIKNDKGDMVWVPQTCYITNWPTRKIDFIKANSVGHVICKLKQRLITSNTGFKADDAGEYTIPFKYHLKEFVATKFIINNATLINNLRAKYADWNIQADTEE